MKANNKRGSKDAQGAKRLLVVEYLKKKRGTQQQAAEIFGLSQSCVWKIWKRYKERGKRGLSSKKRGL